MRNTHTFITTLALCLVATAAETPAIRTSLYFEPNLGQPGLDPAVQFLTRDAAIQTFFTGSETILATKAGQAPIRMQFPGAAKQLRFVGEDPLPGISAYFIGNDKSKWLGRVPHYAKIRAKDVYPGIDLVYYANAENQLEYDFLVNPGADPQKIEISFGGAPVKLNAVGDLDLGQDLFQKKARVYQGTKEVASRYRFDGSRVRFDLAGYDRTQQLTIDPVLLYSRGDGASFTRYYQVRLDAANNAYVAGWAVAPFPLQNAARTTFAETEALVAKYSPSGTLIYATYVGGSADDLAFSLALTPSGAVHVAGFGKSNDFPAIGIGSSRHLPDSINIFHAVLDPFAGPAGNVNLSWATSIPVSSNAQTDLAVDGNGLAHVLVDSGSPVVYRIQPGSGVLNAYTLPVSYGTYLNNIGTDGAGAVYVSGITYQPNIATVNAVQTSIPNGTQGGIVAKIVYSGNTPSIDYLTYVGGTGNLDVMGMAVTPAGKVFLSVNSSLTSPTPNGNPWSNPYSAIWLYALNPRTSGPVTSDFGTYAVLSEDLAVLNYRNLAVDAQENIYLSGSKPLTSGYASCNPFTCTGYFSYQARRTMRLRKSNGAGAPTKAALIDMNYGSHFGVAVSPDRARVAMVGDSGFTQNSTQTGVGLLEVVTQNLTTTIQTNIPNIPIQVDGNPVTSGSALPWIEADEHILDAPASATVNFVTYAFNNWTEGGTRVKTVSPSANTTYQANYTPTHYQISVTKAGNGTVTGGAINCGVTCAAQLPVSSLIALTPTPAVGWTFTGWSGACIGTGACNVTMDTVKTVTATFTQSNTNTTPGGPLVLSIVSKAGTVGGARTWTLSATNNDTVAATGAQLTGFALTQVGGTVCTPVRQTALPSAIGSIASGASMNTQVVISFAGCPANARFTFNATVSANGGAKTGTVTLLNQFQ